jgi:hypothetical protein
MKTLTAILFAMMIGFSGTAFAERDVEGEFPFPQSTGDNNADINCEDACFFHPAFGFYPADDGDTTNDDVNAEK